MKSEHKRIYIEALLFALVLAAGAAYYFYFARGINIHFLQIIGLGVLTILMSAHYFLNTSGMRATLPVAGFLAATAIGIFSLPSSIDPRLILIAVLLVLMSLNLIRYWRKKSQGQPGSPVSGRGL